MGYRWTRRALRLGAAATIAVLTATGTAAPAGAGVPILPGPGVLIAPHYVGAPSAAAPLPPANVPQNPYLAPNGLSNMHDDAYASDAYDGPGPVGAHPSVRSRLYGITECATITFDSQGRIVGLCPDLIGPVLKLIDPTSLDVLGSYRLPNRNLLSGANPLSDVCGGAYFYLDERGRAVIATTDKRVQVVAESGGNSFALQRTYDLSGDMASGDCLIALLPDWAGRIWFVTQGGVVGTIASSTGAVRTVALAGEKIVNSFASDETGGVYIVSDHAMYRFDADPVTGAPVVSWRRAYDRGTRQKPGQLSQGSGTTPTLVGSDMVAITDNADPRMHVIFYDRNTGREICQAPVFAAGQSDTENSIVAVGDSVIVENNYGYQGPQSTLLGRTTAPGIARVAVRDGACRVLWTSQETAPTSVPKVSLASGLLYVYTKPKNNLGIDEWYFTAIDVRTGATVYKQLTGTGTTFNNHYAAIYLGPDGTAYIATLTGLIRIADTP